jgi:putative endonuclease
LPARKTQTAATAARKPARKTVKEKPLQKTPARAGGGSDSFVYVLGTIGKDGRRLTYVGWTNDVARRLARHNDGTGARTTRGRVWVLLHEEPCASRRHAMSREWHLKRDRAFRKKLSEALA